MEITLAMLWDILNQKYQKLETTIYGGQLIRGIKLLPEDPSTLEQETLYLSRENGSIYLCYGRETPERLDTDLTLEKLFNALLDSYARLRDWDMETHLALIEAQGIQTLLELCEDIIGNPLTVMDPSFRLLAHSKRHVDGSSIFAEVCRRGYLPPETVELYRLKGYLDDLNHSGQETAFPGDGDSVSIICPLCVDGRIIGYLNMPCVEHVYSEGIADCFHYLARWVEQCMARELQSKAFNRYMYEYFLQELLEEKNVQPERIAERLAYIDLPLTGKFRLLKLSGKEDGSSISGYLARRLEERLPNVRVFSYSGAVVVLLFEERLTWVLEALLPFCEEQALACGVSRRFTSLMELCSAYEQADAALRLGLRISSLRTLQRLGVEWVDYDKVVFHYDRYATNHMVEAAAQARQCSPMLRALVQMDRKECTDHVRVLYGFLCCERRPTQTAALLHMHRNNVIYRIDRIEHLWGCSLNDPVLRAELTASFYALEMEDI